MQNCRDSPETELQADGRACNQVLNPLVSSMFRLRRVAQGTGAGEWRVLLSPSIGPHE